MLALAKMPRIGQMRTAVIILRLDGLEWVAGKVLVRLTIRS